MASKEHAANRRGGSDMKIKIALAITAALAAAAAQGELYELKYDTGAQALQLGWYTGAGRWVGNAFDVSTLKTKHNIVREMKFYTSPYWPDNQFNGFRLALFDFSAGRPGAKLWPAEEGRFVKPGGTEGFKTFWVDYYISQNKFVAAVEQFYDYPNCDPYFCDTNPTFLNYSWQKDGPAAWVPLVGHSSYPYRNLMLRVIFRTGFSDIGVAPTSLGRVKALYY
jgi:hypothetical protein